MNFNHQSVNGQAAANSHIPLPSGDMGYFSDQALLRAIGYPGLSNIRRPSSGYFPNPINSSDVIQSEIENMRIRDILLAEFVRRRMFDEELGRHLATLNGLGGFLNSPSMMSNHGSSSYFLPSETRETRSLALPEVSIIEESENLPFQRSSASKDNPTLNFSGLKRKAESPLSIDADHEHTPANSSKKMVTMNERNYCAICQIGATSKENLKQHNNGKKHKSNVLKLSQKEGMNCEIGFFPKTTVEKQKMETTVEKHEMETTMEKQEMRTTVEKQEMRTIVEKQESKTTVEKQETKTTVEKQETRNEDNGGETRNEHKFISNLQKVKI